MNISREERGKEGEIERKERGDCTHGPWLHAWPNFCAVPVNGDPSQKEPERELEQEGKWRVVHRQEISPAKLIPKHKSHWPPLHFALKSWSGFIYSSFPALLTELRNRLWKGKKRTQHKSQTRVNLVYHWLIAGRDANNLEHRPLGTTTS